MTTEASSASPRGTSLNPDFVYLNGIDPETGKYAVPPFAIDELARRAAARAQHDGLAGMHGDRNRSFALPFGLDMTNLGDTGWGVVFAEDTPQPVRDALAPLLEHRRKQAGPLFHVLDCKKGEQIRDWYGRQNIAVGTFAPEAVPYYLLLVGPPTGITFEFQYLLGVEYAVGRLAFDQPGDYERYARSVVANETAAAVNNRKEIVYWGTQHEGDPATELSTTYLIEPLANGVPGGAAAVKQPIHEKVGYRRQLFSGEDQATRENLLATFRGGKPPAVLFTASHGLAIRSGRPNQLTDQGALLCQDWPGFGSVRREHCLGAADVGDDANVAGMVAILFACFGGGTPDADQFLMDLGQAGSAPPLAPQPFVAALPRRLLAHPKGGALAVVGHVDRAWGFSIQPAKMTGSQIGPFRNGLGFILKGAPVGYVVTQEFGQRFAALSAALLAAVSPTAPAAARLADRDLVNFWLERNDAQNYVMLGDPAVRIRTDLLA